MRRTSFDLLRRITRLEALNHGPDLEPMDADLAELLMDAAGHEIDVPDRFRVASAAVPHGADPEACRRAEWAHDRIVRSAAAGRRDEEMDLIRAECSAAPRIEWPPGGRAHA